MQAWILHPFPLLDLPHPTGASTKPKEERKNARTCNLVRTLCFSWTVRSRDIVETFTYRILQYHGFAQAKENEHDFANKVLAGRYVRNGSKEFAERWGKIQKGGRMSDPGLRRKPRLFPLVGGTLCLLSAAVGRK